MLGKLGNRFDRRERLGHRNEAITPGPDEKPGIGAIPPAPIVNEIVEVIQGIWGFFYRELAYKSIPVYAFSVQSRKLRKPCSKSTLGAKPTSLAALVMSGQRRIGSPAG